jgi:pantothenate kinase
MRSRVDRGEEKWKEEVRALRIAGEKGCGSKQAPMCLDIQLKNHRSLSRFGNLDVIRNMYIPMSFASSRLSKKEPNFLVTTICQAQERTKSTVAIHASAGGRSGNCTVAASPAPEVRQRENDRTC